MPTGVGVAVVGAVSLVGEALVEVLEERAFPVTELHLLDDSEGVGHTVPFNGRNLRVGEADRFDFSRVQLVFLVAASALLSECRIKALAAGCRIVDLSASIPSSSSCAWCQRLTACCSTRYPSRAPLPVHCLNRSRWPLH